MSRSRAIRRVLGLFTLCVALPFAGGCAKKAGSYSSYADESYYGGDGEYGNSADLSASFGYDPLQSTAMGGEGGAVGSATASAPAAPMPAADIDYADEADSYAEVVEVQAMSGSVAMEARRGGLGGVFERAADRRADRKMEREQAEMGPSPDAARTEDPGPPPEVALEAPDDPGKIKAGKDDERPKDHGRQIIYTAAMIVAVYDVDGATELAESIPNKYGGFVQQRSRGLLVLKVPAAQLRAVMDELAEFGIVQARQLQAQDVTAEYTDLDSRIRVLKETQKQLLALLEKAKTVEETLRVRQALDQVTMELEVALGRMRQLSEAISFSTLTIQFSERRPQHHLPSSNDPFRWVDQLGVEGTEWR